MLKLFIPKPLPLADLLGLGTENRSISCLVGGILQESPNDGDVGEEVAIAIAAAGGGSGVAIKEVPDDGNVVGVEQVAGAAAAAGGVAIAAEEAPDDRDVGEVEAAAATGTGNHLRL